MDKFIDITDNNYPIFSENLPKGLDAYKLSLEAKSEAQKWCLGLDTDLSYHIEVNGTLIKNQTTPFYHNLAAEDIDIDALGDSRSSSVVEEAKYLKSLGNFIKRSFSGLSFQQFAVPMRKMRGAGNTTEWSLHNTGEAIDLFYRDKETLAQWLVSNSSKFKLRVIIDYTNQRSWNSSRKAWKFSSEIDPSYSHIHIDRGGFKGNGKGLSPSESRSTGVRKLVGGLED